MSEQNLPSRTPDLIADVARQRTPAIMTFDEGGAVCDVFGDIAYYADTRGELAGMLADLLVGWHDGGSLYAEVRMPSGKYADVRVVSEGEHKHVVLFDATAAANERREILQSSHETVVRERKRRSQLERALAFATPLAGSDDADAAVLGLLAWQIRARIDEITGHAQILTERFGKSGSEAHSVACIQRAALHLQSWNAACIALLDGAAAEPVEREPIDLPRLARELQRQYGFAERLPSVDFTVEPSPGDTTVVGLDGVRVQQILQCLIGVRLDSGVPAMQVVLSADSERFVADLRSTAAEAGADETAAVLWESDARSLAAKRRIAEMGGTYAYLDPLGTGTRVAIPVSPVQGERRPGPVATVLMAVDDEPLRTRVFDILDDARVEVCEYRDLPALQRDAAIFDHALLLLGGRFAGAAGMAMGNSLQLKGIWRRLLLLRPFGAFGAPACVRDGRTTMVNADADDGILRAAIEEGLGL